MKKLIYILTGIVLLTGCNEQIEKDNFNLNAKVDSLELELQKMEFAIGLLDQIGVYMDSIDANRKWIQVNLETGISEDDYVTRMKDLNLYVQKAEWTISELEKTRSAYASQVKRLKREVMEKDNMIESLQLAVVESRQDNALMETLLNLTETQLAEAQLQAISLKNDLRISGAQKPILIERAEPTDAEKLYGQGESAEQLAGYIRFAPKRKKKILEDALEYYSASLEKGYQPAKAKVDNLVGLLGK